MNFYKHFIGDYSRDTGDLSILEHGAYRLMLDHFYGTSRPLPNDKKALYRMLRAETTAEKKAVDDVSFRFWRPLPENLPTLFFWLNLHTETDRQPLITIATDWTEAGGLINVRALGEIIKAQVQAEKNRRIALDREQKRRQARNGGQE